MEIYYKRKIYDASVAAEGFSAPAHEPEHEPLAIVELEVEELS